MNELHNEQQYLQLKAEYEKLSDKYNSITKTLERYNIDISDLSHELNLNNLLIAKKTSDIIWLLDLNGKSLFVSSSIINFTGFTEKEYLAQTINERFTPESAKRAMDALFVKIHEYKDQVAQNPNTSFTIELEYKCKNGTTKWGELNVTPFYDENGNFVAINGVTHDISERIKSQIIISKQEAQFTDILEKLPNIIVVHKEGKILYANKLGRKAIGISDSGNPEVFILDKVKDEYKTMVIEAMKRRANNETIEDFTIKVMDSNNNYRDVVIRSTEINFNSKPAVLTILIDITERVIAENQIKESEEKFRILAELSPYAIMIFMDNKWVYANPAAVEITGYSANELSISNYFNFIHPDDLEKVKINSMRWLNGENAVNTNEFKIISKDQLTKWVYLTGQRIKYQGKNALLITYTDITKQKTLTQELEEAKDKAEASDRLKTAFLSNISHEIRTPLNGIVNFGEMILRPNLSQDNKNKFHLLFMESTDRLLSTVTDYLDMSLIVSGNQQVRLSNFMLPKVLEKIQLYFLKKIESKAILFSINIDHQLYALPINSDQEFIEKIIKHLVSNSLKFTPENGSISINIYQHSNLLSIKVIDNGTGISENAIQDIFNLFNQEDVSPTRKHEGSGLGLCITKGLIDLLGGTINIESIKDSGTIVTVTLPSKDTTLNFNNTPKAIKSENPKAPILIVEDDPINSFFLKSLLEKEGFEVITANNGKKAIEVVNKIQTLSLILMDLKMPLMDGIEATKQIKLSHPKIPIIATTAYTKSGDEQITLDAGCDGYITKPIYKESLFAKLAEFGIQPTL